jgi:hypothetical protein
MSVTLLYPHPARPDEAGMTVVGDDASAHAVNGLVKRGFQIVKTPPTPARVASRTDSDRQPALKRLWVASPRNEVFV